ncbi:hypothetical protein EDC96DRAFT_533437 [Choanephora cucurbitarum]|nr:hypothetical protein EDC96DRAFT_533437 [Choanephora cucurbitarum]
MFIKKSRLTCYIATSFLHLAVHLVDFSLGTPKRLLTRRQSEETFFRNFLSVDFLESLQLVVAIHCDELSLSVLEGEI